MRFVVYVLVFLLGVVLAARVRGLAPMIPQL